MTKPHAHIYSAEIDKWIAGTLKLPTHLRFQSPHGADLTGTARHKIITGLKKTAQVYNIGDKACAAYSDSVTAGTYSLDNWQLWLNTALMKI